MDDRGDAVEPADRESRAAAAPVDCHVHLWGTGDSDSGIHISPGYRFSLKFLGNGLLLGMHWRAESYDSYFMKLLLRALSDSPLDRAVVQGMDGVYDHRGKLDLERTAILVPNEYTYRVCREHPCLVPAAAINPSREDWREQLELAAANGVAYVKLNPCVGSVDPGDRRWVPYYRRMRELGLVLCSHTGPERALPGRCWQLADPARLELPLSEGLTVIAAHAGTGTFADRLPHFENMVGLMGRYPDLYADTAAVVQIPRWKWVAKLAGNDLVRSRLLHGSDFPVPVSTLPWGPLDPAAWWQIGGIRSSLARDLAVKEAAGYGLESARRAWRVLRLGPAGSEAASGS